MIKEYSKIYDLFNYDLLQILFHFIHKSKIIQIFLFIDYITIIAKIANVFCFQSFRKIGVSNFIDKRFSIFFLKPIFSGIIIQWSLYKGNINIQILYQIGSRVLSFLHSFRYLSIYLSMNLQ